MAPKLNRIGRFLATALAFFLWAIVGVLLQLVLLPYAQKTKNASYATQLKVRRWVSKIWFFFVRYLSWTGVLRVLILSRTPSLNCIVKKDLLKNPTMRNQILACGFLPNSESLELLEQTDAVLQRQALLLFPEGTRTGWDSVVKLNRGAISIGLRSAQVITPVVIKMHPLSLKKGDPWYKIPNQKIHYELIVGEDINPQEWLQKQSIPMASRRLTKYLEDYFNSQTLQKDN